MHRKTLTDDFAEALAVLNRRLRSEIGFRLLKPAPPGERAIVMVKRILARNRRPTSVFQQLAFRNRLDLSIEALVLDPRWERLFSEGEIEVARRRLALYGRSPATGVCDQIRQSARS